MNIRQNPEGVIYFIKIIPAKGVIFEAGRRIIYYGRSFISMETPPDKQAFLRLVQENRGIIIKICNSYCRDKNDREDLAQDIIYQLWKSGHRFNTDYKFSTWMYRVALNVAISYYRKGKRSHPVISFSGIDMDLEDKKEGETQTEEYLHLLQRFIGELKDLDRALILLYLEEKTYSEVAEIIGISETNTATRISRIKDKLKQYFSRLNK